MSSKFDPADIERGRHEEEAEYEAEDVECLDKSESCDGPVEFRMPLSGTGKSFPRCEHHWEERLDRQQEIDERYPNSPFPPADFDPTYAGERWDEDY